MGRFTSVQAFADNNSNLRKLTYEQAVGVSGSGADGDASASGGSGPAPVVTEKVVNPYGSTAGAGSGEFHVYRHARAREMERWKQLDESEQQAQLDKEFFKTQQQNQLEVESRAAKNRRKRQREKEAKQRKKNLKAAGIIGASSDYAAVGKSEDSASGSDPADEEFMYNPEAEQGNDHEKKSGNEDSGVAKDSLDLLASDKIEIRNDGSFMEMMKQKVAAAGSSASSSSPRSGDNTAMKIAIPSAPRDIITNVKDKGGDKEDEGPMLPPSRTTSTRRKAEWSHTATEYDDDPAAAAASAASRKTPAITETKIIDDGENDCFF